MRACGERDESMTRLVFLGGFLGSGKTTTLLRLAGHLAQRGGRVGILTNDQGQDLVDTEIFRATGLETRDVRGGCFCCRLSDFVEQAESLISALKPDFLLAEPVGSCTDLVATVLRPLRHLHSGAFEISPFTVLVDPFRARDALSREGNASFSEKVTYIYRLQQMEADAIAINKADTLPQREIDDLTALLRSQFPAKRILRFSARTGEGFDDFTAWLLGPSVAGPSRSPDIDYDAYAEGEAELAWYDGSFDIRTPDLIDIDQRLMELGVLLRERLSAAELEIAHVKLFVRAGDRICALSIPRGDASPELTRAADVRAQSFDLLVNARVAALPDQLKAVVEEGLRSWAEAFRASVSPGSVASFSPPRPVPTHRIDSSELEA
jgi:Ni2+-binding GTPase involved in maturation of urease and hydrogenase